MADTNPPTATAVPDPRRLDPLKPLPYPDAQRYEVAHPNLGPWRAGDVIQGDTDLTGANLRTLLAMGAVTPTDKSRSLASEKKLPAAPVQEAS